MIVTSTIIRKVTQYKTSTTQVVTQKKGPQGKPSIGHIVILYTQGLRESFKKICGRYGIQTYFKENRTLKQLLVKPKDQDPKDKKSSVIYSYQCRKLHLMKNTKGKHPGPGRD